MNEPTTDDTPSTPPSRPRGPSRRAALEERVRKLELSVDELKEHTPNEEVVADRVIARLGAMAGNAPRVVAAANGTLYDETGVVGPSALQPLVEPPPRGAVLHPPISAPTDPARRSWFLGQLWAEFRLMIRMYFDSHYRVSRTAQFAVPLVIGLFVLNYFLFSVWFSIAVISPICERVIDVLLGVFLYKVLSREMTRYREVLDYMAKYAPR